MGKVKKKIEIGVTEIILISIIILHSLLLLKLSFFPYPELFVYPYLAENGFLPYKQIFDQHLPSVLMFPFNLYDLGLRSAFAGRMFLAGLVALSHLFLFLLAIRIFKSKKKAVLLNLFYFLVQPLFDGNVLWLDSFLVPILLASFYFCLRFLEERKARDLILTGFLLGISLFIKQVMLLLFIGVVVYLLFKTKDLKKVFTFTLVALIPLFYTLIWVYKSRILSEFIFWTVTFNFEVYAKMGTKLPTISQLARALLFFIPAIYWLYLRSKRKETILLGIFMIFSLMAAISRFEFIHLQPSLPFALILTTEFLSQEKRMLKFLYIAILVLAIGLWSARFYVQNWGGLTYFFDDTTRRTAEKVASLSQKDERIFVVGTQPIIYYLAGRLPAGDVFSVNLPWNMKVAEDKILEGLLKDRPKVVVRDKAAEIDDIAVVDFTKEVNSFIDGQYSEVGRVGPNQIMILKDNL